MTKIQKLTIEILVTDDGIGDQSTTDEIINDLKEALAYYESAILIGSRTTDMIEMGDLKLMPEPEPEPPSARSAARVGDSRPNRLRKRGKTEDPETWMLEYQYGRSYGRAAKHLGLGTVCDHRVGSVWLTLDERQAVSDLVRERTQARKARKAKKVSHA